MPIVEVRTPTKRGSNGETPDTLGIGILNCGRFQHSCKHVEVFGIGSTTIIAFILQHSNCEDAWCVHLFVQYVSRYKWFWCGPLMDWIVCIHCEPSVEGTSTLECKSNRESRKTEQRQKRNTARHADSSGSELIGSSCQQMPSENSTLSLRCTESVCTSVLVSLHKWQPLAGS